MNSIIVRLPNIFGVPASTGALSFDTLVPSVCMHLAEGKPIALREPWTRQNVYVSMLALESAVEHLLMENNSSKLERGCRFYNFGYGPSFFPAEVVKALEHFHKHSSWRGVEDAIALNNISRRKSRIRFLNNIALGTDVANLRGFEQKEIEGIFIACKNSVKR